jgi:hypothetical protein|tara:strand:- start:576 stop:1127 length:552 start_codon:yes stop_codon:yes gene_type:complete
MILEFPNYVNDEDIATILNDVHPHVENGDTHMYNRDGKTVNITSIKELSKTDQLLQKIFANLQESLISRRYKPIRESADQDYEYHRYDKGQICHYHTDGEFGGDVNEGCLLRYASVVLHLNTVEEGGELIFPAQNKAIKTEKGKIVVFPPHATHGHYTTPSPEVREIVVTWFVYSDITVRTNK